MQRNMWNKVVLHAGSGMLVLLAVGGLVSWTSGARPGAASVKRLERPVVPASPAEISAGNLVDGLKCVYLDGVRLDEEGGVMVWGWAFDPRSEELARSVMVSLDGAPLSRFAEINLPRPDVRRFADRPALLASGWGLRFPPSALTPGVHAFEAHAQFGDGTFCKLRAAGQSLILVEVQ